MRTSVEGADGSEAATARECQPAISLRSVAEVATDRWFRSRADIERVRQDLVHAAITGFGATDVMRFLAQMLITPLPARS